MRRHHYMVDLVQDTRNKLAIHNSIDVMDMLSTTRLHFQNDGQSLQ